MLQPRAITLSHSLFYSSFYILYAEISFGYCPLFFSPHCSFSLLCTHTHTHLILRCLLGSSPLSILLSKYPFLPLCFFPFFVNLSSRVFPAQPSFCPALSELRGGGGCPRGDALCGWRDERGRGSIVSERRGTDLVRG